MREVLGIDGCRGGWFGIALSAIGGCRTAQSPTLVGLLERWPQYDLALIDIPIGLPRDGKRAVEAHARRLLRAPRASSVFTVPCRGAVYARDYVSACRINASSAGRQLSVQAWNICPKIREADRLLSGSAALAARVLESHPELCFWALAGRRPMRAPKRTKEGRRERLEVLAAHFHGANRLLEEAQRRYLRRDVGLDDIVDALALAVSAASAGAELQRIPTHPQHDDHGLPMQMVFPG